MTRTHSVTFSVLPGPVPRPSTYEDFVRLPPFAIVLGQPDWPGPKGITFIWHQPPKPPAEECLGLLKRLGYTLDLPCRHVIYDPKTVRPLESRQNDEPPAYEATGFNHTIAKIPLANLADCNYAWFKVKRI